jgi:His-Xaa-Ser system protein HxsD
MSDEAQVTVQETDSGVVLSFDESLYPKDAVFGAAYTLLDRCFVHIDRNETKLLVRLRAKPGVQVASDLLAGEFESEALAQSWRREIIRENQALIESVTSRALAGAAGAPGLDDLLDEDLGDLGDAFDDPLGIAVSWEDKYGKADDKPKGAGEPGADGESGA